MGWHPRDEMFRPPNTMKFWMVIRGDMERHGTVKRHVSRIAAAEEAERLAVKEGEAFYVLEATSRVGPVSVPVTWQNL